MAISKTPPQAYTKELLTQAYDWLAKQPESIRYQARDADSLVQLFKYSQRYSSQEHSVAIEGIQRPSSDTFKGELKSLLGMMDQLENETQEESRSVDSSPQPSPVMPTYSASHSRANGAQRYHVSSVTEERTRTNQIFEVPAPPIPVPSAPSKEATLELKLDEISLKTIDRIRELLNLTDRQEVVKALIQIGAKQINKIVANDERF